MIDNILIGDTVVNDFVAKLSRLIRKISTEERIYFSSRSTLDSEIARATIKYLTDSLGSAILEDFNKLSCEKQEEIFGQLPKGTWKYLHCEGGKMTLTTYLPAA